MKEQPETRVLRTILEKIMKKYPNFLAFAVEDFLDYHELDREELNDVHMSQVLIGFIFTRHEIYDGKTTIQLARQVLTLSEEEERMLSSIEQAVTGYFEIISHAGNIVKLHDLFTKNKYDVHVLDIGMPLKKGDVIEATLAKRLDGNRYFFGGFYLRTKEKKDILHDLQTYHMTEREAG